MLSCKKLYKKFSPTKKIKHQEKKENCQKNKKTKNLNKKLFSKNRLEKNNK